MTSLYTWILGIITAVVGIFLFNKKVSSNISSDDKVLDYRINEENKSIEEQKASVSQLEKDHDNASKEIEKPSTPEQNEDFWKKR